MSVHLVVGGEYEDWFTVGAYSTAELAEAKIADCQSECGWETYYRLEVPLDE